MLLARCCGSVKKRKVVVGKMDKIRVFLADASEDYLTYMRAELVSGGFEVVGTATDGRAALRAFGIPPHLTGYAFLAEALMRAAEDRTWLRGVTKVLYPGLAEQFASTPECVERAIRVAVEKAWIPRNEDRRRAYFGDAFDSFDKAPTNARFLAIVTEVIDEKTLWEN